jgi:hypothetical protein
MKALLIVWAAIFTLSMQSAQACRQINLESARKYADIIFIGMPVKVSPPFMSKGTGPTIDRNKRKREFSFRIHQVIKGPELKEIGVRSADHSCSTLYYIKKLNPSRSGYYLIYATRDRAGGSYKTDISFPSYPMPQHIDPRFPSLIWTINPNRAAVALYWLTRKRSRYRWGAESHITQQEGMILPHKDGIIHPAQ